MFNKVLLAVDGSKNSINACQHAIALVQNFEGAIDVVYVVDKEKTKDSIHYASNQGVLEKQKEERIAPVVAMLEAADAIYSIHILQGDPAEEIVHLSNRRLVDCIVIGSRGLNPLQKLIIGSVSTKVIKYAECPVFVIK